MLWEECILTAGEDLIHQKNHFCIKDWRHLRSIGLMKSSYFDAGFIVLFFMMPSYHTFDNDDPLGNIRFSGASPSACANYPPSEECSNSLMWTSSVIGCLRIFEGRFPLLLMYQKPWRIDYFGWNSHPHRTHSNQFMGTVSTTTQYDVVFLGENATRTWNLENDPWSFVLEKIIDLPTTVAPNYDCEICENIYLNEAYQVNDLDLMRSQIVFTGTLSITGSWQLASYDAHSRFTITPFNGNVLGGEEVISDKQFLIIENCELRYSSKPCTQSWEISFTFENICEAADRYLVTFPIEGRTHFFQHNQVMKYVFDVKKTVCGRVTTTERVRASIRFMDKKFQNVWNHTSFQLNSWIQVEMRIEESVALSRSTVKELAFNFFESRSGRTVFYNQNSSRVDELAKASILSNSPTVLSPYVVRFSMFLDADFFWVDDKHDLGSSVIAGSGVITVTLDVVMKFELAFSTRRVLWEEEIQADINHNGEVPSRRQLLNAQAEDVGYNFKTDFFVIEYRCIEPFADFPGITPGSYYFVMCNNNNEEMVKCEVGGWSSDPCTLETFEEPAESYDAPSDLLYIVLMLVIMGIVGIAILLWLYWARRIEEEPTRPKVDSIIIENSAPGVQSVFANEIMVEKSSRNEGERPSGHLMQSADHHSEFRSPANSRHYPLANSVHHSSHSRQRGSCERGEMHAQEGYKAETPTAKQASFFNNSSARPPTMRIDGSLEDTESISTHSHSSRSKSRSKSDWFPKARDINRRHSLTVTSPTKRQHFPTKSLTVPGRGRNHPSRAYSLDRWLGEEIIPTALLDRLDVLDKRRSDMSALSESKDRSRDIDRFYKKKHGTKGKKKHRKKRKKKNRKSTDAIGGLRIPSGSASTYSDDDYSVSSAVSELSLSAVSDSSQRSASRFGEMLSFDQKAGHQRKISPSRSADRTRSALNMQCQHSTAGSRRGSRLSMLGMQDSLPGPLLPKVESPPVEPGALSMEAFNKVASLGGIIPQNKRVKSLNFHTAQSVPLPPCPQSFYVKNLPSTRSDPCTTLYE